MSQPKLTKLTKTARKQLVRQALATGNYDRYALAAQFNLKERSIRNYVNEIAREESQENPELLHVLRNLCVKNLLGKASKKGRKGLSDKFQVAIVLSGETQTIKQEINQAITERKVVIHMWKPAETVKPVETETVETP